VFPTSDHEDHSNDPNSEHKTVTIINSREDRQRNTGDAQNEIEIEIAQLKEILIDGSSCVPILQAINRATLLCLQNPRYTSTFIPILKMLLDSSFPWVQKEARKNLIEMQNIESKWIRSKDNPNSMSTTEDVASIILGILAKKNDYQAILRNASAINKRDAINDELPKAMIERLIQTKNLTFIQNFFKERDLHSLARKLGIKNFRGKEDLEKVYMEIYKRAGINLDRSDLLEI